MIPLLLDEHTDSAAARTILPDLFRSAADILPEPECKRLRVCVHHAARPVVNRRLKRLFDELNATKLTYPGTELTMQYELLAADPSQPHNGVTDNSER